MNNQTNGTAPAAVQVDAPLPPTDEEIDALFNKSHNPKDPPWVNWRRFARAVLADRRAVLPLLPEDRKLMKQALAALKSGDFALVYPAIDALIARLSNQPPKEAP